MTYLDKPLNECTPSERWKRNNRQYFLLMTKKRAVCWRKNNPEKYLLSMKKYRDKNKEYFIDYLKEWRKTHPDKRLNRLYEFSKRWRKNNQQKIKLLDKVRHHKRRALGNITLSTLQSIYENNIKTYGTLTCYLCLKPIKFKEDSLEHKIPVSRGGDNNITNLAIAHLTCNMKKRTKTYEEYIKENEK